jgi:hypothetical protein
VTAMAPSDAQAPAPSARLSSGMHLVVISDSVEKSNRPPNLKVRRVMNQPVHSLTKPIASAERELSAFFSAVGELFGPEEAALAANEWLQQLKAMKTLPVSPRQFRQQHQRFRKAGKTTRLR